MEKTGWKILAIISMVILGLLISVIALGVSMVNDEEQKNYECSIECGRNDECFSGYYNAEDYRCDFITYNDLQYFMDSR